MGGRSKHTLYTSLSVIPPLTRLLLLFNFAPNDSTKYASTLILVMSISEKSSDKTIDEYLLCYNAYLFILQFPQKHLNFAKGIIFMVLWSAMKCTKTYKFRSVIDYILDIGK